MSVRILHDQITAAAALYDSVTGTAFGPLFRDAIEAAGFLDWNKNQGYDDVRSLTDNELEDLVSRYRQERAALVRLWNEGQESR